MTAHDVARALPEISLLRDRCRVLATLDAVMSPEWDWRYFSFDSRWAPGEDMASMRNGSGDEWSIVFSSAGGFVRGFDHESDMSPYANDGKLWPGLVDKVPPVFTAHLTEPAFCDGATLLATVCLWRQVEDDGWRAGDMSFPPGDDPDGANWLLEMLVRYSPEAYERFAEDYYEADVDSSAVSAIFALEPLTQDLVQRLNPDADMETLADDLAQIGYPRL
ncbi:hypothetical protein V5D56_02525 [Cellulosimicrobium sp. PMB13]|uniref:hypothetical protein n=1 Tax=Cellulosimicrobium sp. PMB13 TaxID=3120158 RepID=UPI003F4C7EB1